VEADWAVEMGGEASWIETEWAGFADLRREPEAVDRVAEVRAHPALRAALLELNGPGSPVFTSKCDVWTMAEAIDPLEFDCGPEEARAGIASYVDVVAAEPELFPWFAGHEAWVRRAAAALRGSKVRRGRVDLVVRAAMAGGVEGFGVTVYAAGCGVDPSAAERAWGEILQAAVVATMREARASSSIG
jgi:hypothetical protein